MSPVFGKDATLELYPNIFKSSRTILLVYKGPVSCKLPKADFRCVQLYKDIILISPWKLLFEKTKRINVTLPYDPFSGAKCFQAHSKMSTFDSLCSTHGAYQMTRPLCKWPNYKYTTLFLAINILLITETYDHQSADEWICLISWNV